MSSVQTKTLITLTLRLPDLEVDVSKEVSLDQLRRINAQISRLYEDSNLILGKISMSTHSSSSLSNSSLFTERLDAAWNWIKNQTKPFNVVELVEATKSHRSYCYDILSNLECKKLIQKLVLGQSYSWTALSPKNNIKPSTPGGVDVETSEQTIFRQNVAEQKASELKARIDSR